MNASITLNNLHFYWMSRYILPKGETLKQNLIHITFPRANLFEIEYSIVFLTIFITYFKMVIITRITFISRIFM